MTLCRCLIICAAGLLMATGVLHADAVTNWNTIALDAIRADKTPPPKASRALAMISAAVYDSVNAIDKTYRTYRVVATASDTASREAAATQAAYTVLTSLFPTQKTTFDDALASSLAAIPDGMAKTEGVDLGTYVANQTIAWRSNDHSSDIVPYTPGDQPGQWRPTPPKDLPALLPNWPDVTPFAMTSGSQFRGAGPPALTSADYTWAFNDTKLFGAATGSVRSADQTEIANFWSDGGGTATPPGHWNLIAQEVALARGNTLSENARLFGLLNIALADAAIVAWDDKYAYNFWRPTTAIQLAGTDGNPDTMADPNWTPLLETPNFPEYVSGHSTFSAAAAEILADFFGNDLTSFTIGSDGLPNVTRSFASFSEAAEEAGRSRIYGGIHFQFSNEEGLHAGRDLGEYTYSNFMQAVPEPSALAGLASGMLGVLLAWRMKAR